MPLIPETTSGHRLPGEATPRQASLQRMRNKLAGLSEPETKRNEKLRIEKGRNFWSRGGRIAGLILATALSWAGLEREKLANLLEAPKIIPRIANPTVDLNPDRQLLYWTYALYDWDRFKAEFQAAPQGILNSEMARQRIREMLPRAGKQVAFRVRMYQTNAGRIQ